MVETSTLWTATQYLDLHQTKSTRRNYAVSLKQFFSFIYETEIPKKNYEEIIDELSRQYLSEDRDYSKDAAKYYNSLEDYAPTSRSHKFSTFKSWLEVNGISINPGVLRSLNGQKGAEAISEEHVPTKDEVARILKHLPLHCRSLALTILSGGLRPGEGLTLSLNNIDLESYPVKISLKGRSTKTGRKRWTYNTPEAKAEMEAWLKYRDEFIKKNLSHILGEANTTAYLNRVENLIYPFSGNTFIKNWRAAVEKAGLLKIDGDTGRMTLRPHNLRKYFSTHGKWKDKDIANFFQGHINGIRAVYNRYDQAEETVREAYIAAIPSLTIGEGFGDTEKVEKLEEKIETFQEAKGEDVKNIDFLLTENRTSKVEIDKLRTQVDNLQGEIQHILKWMDTEINSRAVLLSGGTDETILASEEEALADLQEKKSAKNR